MPDITTAPEMAPPAFCTCTDCPAATFNIPVAEVTGCENEARDPDIPDMDAPVQPDAPEQFINAPTVRVPIIICAAAFNGIFRISILT